MDGKTYDAILWILDHLKKQQVPPDLAESIRIIEGHLTEIEKENAYNNLIFSQWAAGHVRSHNWSKQRG
jgi:hypothetical protein